MPHPLSPLTSHVDEQVVKNERNKTHSQILVMQQVTAELADKSKILANEVDILHSKIGDQDK